jgi:hypothetical protein
MICLIPLLPLPAFADNEERNPSTGAPDNGDGGPATWSNSSNARSHGTPTITPTPKSNEVYFDLALGRKHTDYTPSTDSAWTNLANLTAAGPDGSWVDVSLPAGARSEYLQAALSDNRAIEPGTLWELRGIEVSVTRKCSAANGCFTHSIGLVRPDKWGTIEGNVAADIGDDWATGAGETVVYGGPNELWGISDWSWADVRSGRLSFVLRANNASGSSATASIDAVAVKAYWRAPDAVFTPVPTGTRTQTPTWTLTLAPGASMPTPTPTNTPVCVGFYNGMFMRVYRIGRAETSDPNCDSGWYRFSGNPILGGTPFQWDSGGTYHPYVAISGVEGYTYLYYIGRTVRAGPFEGQIGLARSTDGGKTFTKCTVPTCGAANPIIPRCASGTWCGDGFELPVILYDEFDVAARRWKLYAGGHNDVSGVSTIGYFYSADGINWSQGTKCVGGANAGDQCMTRDDCPGGRCDNANPILTVGSAGSFDDSLVLPASIVYDPQDADPDKRWKLFYSGFRVQGDRTWLGDLGARAQGGCATAPFPTGPFTRCGGNPILDRAAAATAEIIYDAVPGSHVVNVRDAGLFSAGDAVWIGSRFRKIDQYNIVKSVDTGADTITFVRPLRKKATVADGTVVRVLHSISTGPTSIYYDRAGRRWLGFATDYQMIHEPFYDATREWIAAIKAPTPCPDAMPCSSELTKEWVHTTNGALLDPDQCADGGRGWDCHSSENLSLMNVAAPTKTPASTATPRPPMLHGGPT